jgi:hypothetical protein
MATVASPAVPEYLYRYRSLGPEEPLDILNREMDAIINPYIWCSDFLKLNDPMEGAFSLSVRLQKKPNSDRVLQTIINGQTNVGIAALSDTFANDIMWTHYASNWTGICIEYRAKKLIAALPNDATIVRMAYNERVAEVGLRDSKDIDEAVKKVFSQKKFNWAYEREWRVLGRKEERNRISDKRAVRRVFLGPRIGLEHSVWVRTALDRAGIKYRAIVAKDYSITHEAFKPMTRF